MATTYHADIQKLYVAYFNRPADYAGLNFWESVVEAANGDTTAVAAAFAASDEYKATYGSLDAYQVVNKVYNNLFGRDADVAGLKFWAEALIAGTFTVDQAVTTIAAGAQNDDLTTFNNKVTAAGAFTDALDTTREILGYSGETANNAAKEFLSGVTTDASLAAAIDPTALNNAIDKIVTSNPINVGKTFTLTAGVDQGAAFTGTANNDTFVAAFDSASGKNTLGGLDILNGGAGNDTLAITSDDINTFELSKSATLNSIENITIAAASAVVANVAGANVVGTTSLKVTNALAATLTAGAGTDIGVSGATGAITINGGNNVNVAAATAAQSVTIGATTVNAGAVAVTHTNQAAGSIAIDGGNGVTVNASKASTGTITIGKGGAATDAAKGAVVVNTTGADYANAVAARGAITITGGSTVTVTEVATSSDAAAATGKNVGNSITQGAVTVNGTADTTSVTVTQDAAVGPVDGQKATAGVKEIDTVTFTALAANGSVTVGGLTFTASKILTAAQVAAAFANLKDGVTQGAAASANGSYSGTFSGFSTGAVTTVGTAVTVGATATTAATGGAIISTTGATAVVKTAGLTAVAGIDGVMGVIGGKVEINGQITGADVLATVSLDGYGAGSTVKSDALTTLNLANSDKGLNVTNAAATTLALGLNNVGVDAIAAINIGSTYTTANIASSGDDSAINLTAGGVQALNVSGTNTVDLSGSTLTALKTVTVTGEAGLTVDASGAAVTSVNTTGTTGTVTASINASKATYTGGAGDDIVTLTNTTVSKAISTGAGDDTVNLAAGTTSLAAVIDGGEGTDTLGMAAADAAAVSGTSTFATKFTGFEKLSLGAVASGASNTVDLANLNNINYVISANTPAGTAGEVQKFTVTRGTSAAVAEQQTFTVTGFATTAGNITVGGTTIKLTGSETIDEIGTKIAAATFAATSPIASAAYDALTDTVTLTYKTSATNAPAATIAAGATGATFGAVLDNAVAYAANAGNITIGGVTVAVAANSSVDDIGAAIAAQQAAIIAGNANIRSVTYDNVTDTVTVNYLSSAGDVGNITIVDTDSTGATFGTVTESTKGGTTGTAGTLIVKNIADGGTLELTDGGAGATVQLADATGTANTFNIVTKVSTGNLDFGNVTVAGVETVNLTVTDTEPTTDSGAASIDTGTLNITDAALKSLVITGNANVSVTATSTALTSVDASAATGNVTFSTLSTAAAAATVTGGSGNDTLTAKHAGDTLIGGAGNDVLIVNANQVMLTGGEGADTFDVGFNVTNVNSYATITDLTAGDVIKLADIGGVTETFASAAVSLGSTAVFQDYANAAIAATNTGAITWFQFGGDTYVVENIAHETSFKNGTDIIVKIAGTVDLSTASFNSANQTLLIG